MDHGSWFEDPLHSLATISCLSLKNKEKTLFLKRS